MPSVFPLTTKAIWVRDLTMLLVIEMIFGSMTPAVIPGCKKLILREEYETQPSVFPLAARVIWVREWIIVIGPGMIFGNIPPVVPILLPLWAEGEFSVQEQPRPDITIALTGAAPWSLTYSDGSISTSISSITATPYVIAQAPAGTYTVSAIRDANCSGTASGMVTVSEGALSIPRVEVRGILGSGNCSVSVAVVGTGNSYVLTGPGGYVFSTVYRSIGEHSVVFPSVVRPGLYTLTIYSGSCTDQLFVRIKWSLIVPLPNRFDITADG